MKKELSVGDRCRVFHRHESFKGKIDAIAKDGSLFVIEDGFYSCHNEAPFHPEQCRRLVKKKVSATYPPRWKGRACAYISIPDGDGIREFDAVEIRPEYDEVILDSPRKRLENALKLLHAERGSFLEQVIAEALGLSAEGNNG